ncbi:periplasmic heavy metal sensor [Marinovum sp.]|uniref:periplasmic heavy metal sensor n=1 Tax=Marinovum sp. TaxID=2024839 RepID=UPI002B2742B3|nr:periplasmic heavy metal sensor [Marinovum sp.]
MADDLKSRRISPGLRIVLFLSLAANLAIAGVVAGFVLTGGPGKPPPRNPRDAVAPYTQALTRDDRRALGRQLFAEMRKEGTREDLRARARAEYREALEALRAEPFDPAGFAEVLARQNERAAERQQRGQDILVSHVAAMSPEDRAGFADRVAAALERGDRDRK